MASRFSLLVSAFVLLVAATQSSGQSTNSTACPLTSAQLAQVTFPSTVNTTCSSVPFDCQSCICALGAPLAQLFTANGLPTPTRQQIQVIFDDCQAELATTLIGGGVLSPDALISLGTCNTTALLSNPTGCLAQLEGINATDTNSTASAPPAGMPPMADMPMNSTGTMPPPGMSMSNPPSSKSSGARGTVGMFGVAAALVVVLVVAF